jgi:hypothetical protein
MCIISHDHGSFMGFLFVAGTLKAKLVGLHAATRRVYRPIRGYGHDLLQAAASTSLLLMLMVGMKSYRRGSAAAMGR